MRFAYPPYSIRQFNRVEALGGRPPSMESFDENMREAAQWIVANTPFDRLYF